MPKSISKSAINPLPTGNVEDNIHIHKNNVEMKESDNSPKPTSKLKEPSKQETR